MLLSKKVIVITGGASGIGYECVKAYIKEGALVALLDVQQERLAGAMGEIGSQHLGLHCDVSDEDQVKVSIAQVLQHYGRIDCIHNNAGIASPSKPLHETSVAEWQALMNVNVFSIYLTTRYALPALQESKGCIVNTSSMVAQMGQAHHAAYTATKGAINALTKSMALDYAAYGIRVNAVAPAGVWTPLLRSWTAEQPDTAGIEKYLDEIHPLGYCPEGDVIADACVFLVSDKARFVTGCILPVGGGAELGYRR
ncbi:SDR family NAD(P)-dependent oxidoreductase [Niabella drilacis]|uniref:NAD(P)-dependent dehydrogenase, short-chain alcohol dehydrogenase family n=1 Tax=Niabella drilacis (strain DSM 25811 / CCM 8410 / CCUG 62505 / LMG 26954 / E90) TaxID=1285928 RepID=A0A1G7BKL0_NIADE|nr:SDR family oxidoreductase [Niabella drilacis]SDE26815.1 NAD(P)-dependent dehydrogenase, short-chain alcohol dehydrogenase family [Niabella drilacis]